MRAQELLSTVRAQVLLSSVRVRDARLNPNVEARSRFREQIESAHQIASMALTDYEPVLGPASEQANIDRLVQEVKQFHLTSLDVLADAARLDPTAAVDALNRHIIPRREAAVAISEEIQSLNRRAFVTQQADIAEIHRVAEGQSRRQLGIALVVGLGTLLVTSLYAGRLESRLRHQLQRDARISRELHETATKLIGAQEEERRTV